MFNDRVRASKSMKKTAESIKTVFSVLIAIFFIIGVVAFMILGRGANSMPAILISVSIILGGTVLCLLFIILAEILWGVGDIIALHIEESESYEEEE